MNTAPISQRLLGLFEQLAPVYRFFTQSTYTRRAGDPTICGFVAGNPHQRGTFYLLPRSPLVDDLAFIELLAEKDVFCLPGTVVEMRGHFCI